MNLLILFFFIVISTFILTKIFIKILPKYGFYGIDLHKEDRRIVAENVGISVIIPFLISLIIFYKELGAEFFLILFVISSLTSFFGFIDRIFKFKPREKILGLALIGMLLIPFVDREIFGINLSYLSYIIIPIGFSISCNLTNMLAGLNGLEVGLALINSIFLTIISYLKNNTNLFLIFLILTISLAIFLRYNFYPARAFPGDTLTLTIGAIYFSSMIYYDMDILLIPLLLLNAFDAFLKFITAGIMYREKFRPTLIKNGKLYYNGGYLSLIRLMLKIKPDKEWRIVLKIYLLQIIVLILFFNLKFAF